MAYTNSKTDWDKKTEPTTEEMNRLESNIETIANETFTFRGNKTFSDGVDIEGVISTTTTTEIISFTQTNATAGDYYTAQFTILEPGTFFIGVTGTATATAVFGSGVYASLLLYTDAGAIQSAPITSVGAAVGSGIVGRDQYKEEGARCLNPGKYALIITVGTVISAINLTFTLKRAGRFAGGISL